MKRYGSFTNGAHAYHGRNNSRGQRFMSKLHAGGIKPPSRKAWREVEHLSKARP